MRTRFFRVSSVGLVNSGVRNGIEFICFLARSKNCANRRKKVFSVVLIIFLANYSAGNGCGGGGGGGCYIYIRVFWLVDGY